MPQKNMIDMKRWIFIARSVSLSIGSLTGGKKSVEIYLFDFKEDGTGYPYLYKTVTAQNKEDLHLVMFPNLKITFDELFDIGEY